MDSQLSFLQLYKKMSSDLNSCCFMLHLIISLARQKEWDEGKTNAMILSCRVRLLVSDLAIRLSEEHENILNILHSHLNKF